MTPYLYLHENRYAPKRENGLRFHGYPGRSQRIRLIGVHTTESLFDLIGEDTGAEGVARFQSETERPSSYHRIADRDSTVVCLPDEATAFGIGNLNSPTLHLSLAMRAADWSDPARHRLALPTLGRAADVAAEWVRAHNIELRWLTREQAFGNASGFVRHGTADPDRRSDPGKDFPAGLFLELVADRLTTHPATSTVQEDDMARLITEDGKRQAATDGVRVWPVPNIPTRNALAKTGLYGPLDDAGNPKVWQVPAGTIASMQAEAQ